jgi:NADH-quinone oxidoreductase subunit L
MPITAFCFVIATLAIIGFPGFSGFFSKDALLAMAWGGPFGHPLLWFVGWLTAGCTAFYMLRLTCLVFFGTSRVADPEHVHENNVVVTLPLIVLALLSALGGFFVLPEVFTGKPDVITSFLAPVLAPTQNILQATHPSTYPLSHTTELVLMGASVGIVLFAAVLAMKVYRVGPQGGEKFTKLWGGLYRLVLDKWRVDELYAVLFVAPFAALGRALYRFVHQLFLEGVVNGVPEILYTTTSVVSDGQSGMARNYLKFIFFSLIFLGMILFF